MEEKTISSFLSSEYKEFAFYSIEGRALASCIDGFKPVHRKIMHTSNLIWKNGNEKPLKVFQLSGKIAAECYYHHGDSSLGGAIVTLAQTFKNNVPFLKKDGQFGSLRSPQASAPRYIGASLSENFRLIYKDFDLLTYKEEEGESIEPEFFLPIIPTILLNGSQGIAVGFASNILNRDIIDIIDACIKVLNGKKINEIKPHLNDFTGEYIQNKENNKKWTIRGKFMRLNTTTIKITELPPSITYEKYEDYLDTLIDNKLITSYDDNCKDNIDYTIKFPKNELGKLKDDDLIKLLKLEETSTEIFSTLDEFGKLKIFENTIDIIKYFINFRLTYYDKRKQFILNKLNKELKIIDNRIKFIKAIINNKLKINNIPKIEIISKIKIMKLDMIDDSYDYLLKMPIYSLTKEMYEKLEEEFKIKNIEIKKVTETNSKDMYIIDLNELKKKYK